MIKALFFLALFLTNVSAVFADDEIFIKCDIKDTVSGRANGKILIPESQNITEVFRFFKEKVEVGKQYNDFTKSPPVISDNSKNKEERWVLEKNGIKLQPINIETLNKDGSRRIENSKIFVEDTTLIFSDDYSIYEKSNTVTYGHKIFYSINRISGIISGEMIQFHNDQNTLITSEYYGKCTKTNKKF